jgi:hypothetical protein
VENPEHVSKGIKEISVNGRSWEEELLPMGDAETYDVTVILGA